MKKLIIVESPTKAKTISKFLPKTYVVKSSLGHIRDLPKKEMGIDIENNFKPKYEIPEKSKKTISELKKLASTAEEVILATDEDREGEAIAWHLAKILKLNPKETKRIVFHEITKTAIEKALATPRILNQELVDAQQARRILDRLVGYELSPFLWKKIQYGLSAGRVQSVAVKLVCQKEAEIQKFKPEEYWTIEADLKKQKDDETNKFSAKLIKKSNTTLDKFAISNEKESKAIMKDLKESNYKVSAIKHKQTKKKAPTPFTTSTLQQAASSKLGFSAKQTMRIAQQLYEGIKISSQDEVGLITYMRTDSQNLSQDVLKKIRDFITQEFGKDYLPSKEITYKTKSKGAQEAHEAIRPTFPDKHPDEMGKHLKPEQFKLYNLIWRRSIACQMNPMVLDSTSIDISAQKYIFRTSGAIIKFKGWQAVYKTAAKETILPEIKEQEELDLLKLSPIQHFTEPPARYSEASLIKSLEEHGIGRPSTYAPTISTIQERKYVIKNKNKKFEPTDIGELVNKVLSEHFKNIVDIDFTAKMEETLDNIAHDKLEWQPMISAFYGPFKKNIMEKDKELTKKELTEEPSDEVCDKCQSPMVKKMGRYGRFLACSNYPECKNTKPLEEEGAENENQDEIPKECDKCGGDMVLKTGKFGKFLACSNYPECKNTQQVGTNNEPLPDPVKSDKKCDKCGQPMIVKMGRYGRFLACSAYPKCKNIMPITIGLKCPKCKQGELAEKQARGKTFYSCTKYPDCKFALWSKPTGSKCPKCKSLLIYAAKGTTACSNKECDYKTESTKE